MAFITGAGLITIKNTSEDFFFFNGTNPSLTDNYTFTASQILGYSKLDYILVGGGGGGGGPFTSLLVPYPGGGGGSGDIRASFPYTGTSGTFTLDDIKVSVNPHYIAATVATYADFAVGAYGGAFAYNNMSKITISRVMVNTGTQVSNIV